MLLLLFDHERKIAFDVLGEESLEGPHVLERTREWYTTSARADIADQVNEAV